VEALSLNIREILLSFGVTFISAVIAALQPAREAMSVASNEALEISQHGLKRSHMTRRLAAMGITTTLTVMVLERTQQLNIKILGSRKVYPPKQSTHLTKVTQPIR